MPRNIGDKLIKNLIVALSVGKQLLFVLAVPLKFMREACIVNLQYLLKKNKKQM
jgi:hypothetical protein